MITHDLTPFIWKHALGARDQPLGLYRGYVLRNLDWFPWEGKRFYDERGKRRVVNIIANEEMIKGNVSTREDGIVVIRYDSLPFIDELKPLGKDAWLGRMATRVGVVFFGLERISS